MSTPVTDVHILLVRPNIRSSLQGIVYVLPCRALRRRAVLAEVHPSASQRSRSRRYIFRARSVYHTQRDDAQFVHYISGSRSVIAVSVRATDVRVLLARQVDIRPSLQGYASPAHLGPGA